MSGSPEYSSLRRSVKHWPIAVLVLASLALGFLLAPQYGQSTDEAENVRYGRESLRSYEHPEDPYRDASREDKGPFYLMLWASVGEFLGESIRGWVSADGRHFVNFFTFQLAVMSVYVLSRRFVGRAASLAAALLFETQPLFFGHAFINQKDTPFMALFAFSVALGLRMVDQWSPPRASPGDAVVSPGDALRAAIRQDPGRARRAGTAVLLLALPLPLARMLFDQPLRAFLESVIRDAYEGTAWEPISALFARFAEHADRIPVEAYVAPAVRLANAATILASLGLALLAITWAARLWPGAIRRLSPALRADARAALGAALPSLAIPAAVVLGMSLAVRSTAMFAGLLVALFGLLRLGPRGLALIGIYLGGALFVAYALWPQLWGSPLGLWSASLGRTLQYPQVHLVLFEGRVYSSQALPYWYLPKLVAIQFTLPALGLILVAPAVVLRGISRLAVRGRSWAVLLLWFLLPMVAVVGMRVPIYNNFRHVLFMMPPLFVLAAVVFDHLLRQLHRRGLQALLIAGVLLPGVAAIVRLHPYEYGYYNELVGGVRGAYGDYMSDYWCTSYREAIGFVNAIAPAASAVAIAGPELNAKPFARPDLVVREDENIYTDPSFDPMWILGCSWSTIDPGFFPDATLVFSVRREGVPLAIVKQRDTPSP